MNLKTNMYEHCLECGNPINTDALKNDNICIRCYLDSPIVGEAYRRSDDPSSKIMSVDNSNEFAARVEEYWSKRNTNSVDQAVNNLSKYVDDVEMPPLLAKLILHTGVARQRFLDKGNDTGLGSQFVEYVLGVAACQSPTGTSGEYYELLREASAVPDLISVAESSENDDEKTSAAYKLAIREITLGRIASPGQYIEAAKRFYRPHSSRMESQFGFSIDDVIKIATAIRDEKDSRDSNLYDEIPDIADQLALLDRIVLFRSKIPEIASEHEHKVKSLSSWNPELATNLYWISPARIKKRTELSDERAQAVLDFLSVSLGDASEYKDPSDHNPLHETPLLEYENKYLLPVKGLVEYAISTTFKYQLRTDDYGDEFNDTMGEVVESWTEDILTSQLNAPTVLTNVEYVYDGDEYETDVVLIAGDTIAVFECKSKGLTLPTRKGHRGGVEELEDDLEKGLGKAYSQAHRLIEAIEAGAVTELVGEAQTVDVSHCTEFQPCAIVPEAYDSLVTTSYPSFIDAKKYPLYAASVFDLEPVAATHSSPSRFVEYLKWRATLVTNNDVYTADEDDLIQAFLNDTDWMQNANSTVHLSGTGLRFKNDIYEYDSEYAYE